MFRANVNSQVSVLHCELWLYLVVGSPVLFGGGVLLSFFSVVNRAAVHIDFVLMDDSLDSSDYYQEPPGKAQRLKRKASLSNNVAQSAGESVPSVEIHPVVLQCSLDRTLKSFNPIVIDRCLQKCIGDYDACLPRHNGNLLVKCKSPHQLKPLLNTSTLSDGTVSISILSSLLQPMGAKGVIYNVLLDITVQEIQVCLQSLVKFVKIFKLWRDTTNEYFDSQTVLLHFASSQLPKAVKIGYLNFRVREFIPKPTHCYKCNRFGHVAKNCIGKDKCSKCSGDHSSQHCTSATTQCPNCNGERKAGDRQCPKYRRESEVLRIKTTSKVSYATACRLHRQSATAVHPQTTFSQRSREFPPLPVVPEGNPTGYRPFPNSKPSTVHEPRDSMECEDFATNFPFGNPLLF